MNQIENNELRLLLASHLNEMTVMHDDLIGQYRGELKYGATLAEVRQMESRIDSEVLGARYGEKVAIDEATPVLIEQPDPPKTGLGIVLLKIAMGR